MSDFDEFTRKLRGEHEAKSRDHEADVARRRGEQDAQWDADHAAIEQVAMPLFEDAKRACEAQGLRPVIVTNWESGRYQNPMIEFQLFGPKQRPHEASTYEIEANKVIVRVEDGKLRASIGKRASKSKANTDYVGYGEEGVSQALKHSIQSYFEEVAPENR